MNVGPLAYVGIILTVLSMIIVIFLHYRKSRLCRGYRFSNSVIYLRCTKLYTDKIGAKHQAVFMYLNLKAH